MIGIDIIKTSRMESLIKRFGEKALYRFLCKDEIALTHGKSTTAAGFWAAKEAFSKALGTGIGSKFSFHDIKIYKDALGAPKIALSRKLAKSFSILDVALSITHDGDYAISVVTIESTSSNKVKQF